MKRKKYLCKKKEYRNVYNIIKKINIFTLILKILVKHVNILQNHI